MSNKYPIGGYAPGNYTCICCICKKEFQGDKRSVQCELCAVRAVSNETTVYVPCAEDDPRCCGGYTSNDGRSLCYVRETTVPVIEQGAVWIKASERLPEKDGYYCFKANGGYMGAYLRTGSNGNRWWCDSAAGTIRNWKNCEWLDESPSKEIGAAVNKLIEFVRDCAENWDCDSDSHTYGTQCRKCEAIKLYQQSNK